MSSVVIGIDYSTYRAHVCALPLDGPISRVRMIVAQFRPDRASGDAEAIRALARVDQEIRAAVSDLRWDDVDQEKAHDAEVWIERGYGGSRRSDWSLGAYFGAIYAACSREVPTNPMDLRKWKEVVTGAAGIGLVKDGTKGNGNAKKEVANDACRALLEVAEVDASGWSPDHLDAFGVAYAARKMNRKAAGLAV